MLKFLDIVGMTDSDLKIQHHFASSDAVEHLGPTMSEIKSPLSN